MLRNTRNIDVNGGLTVFEASSPEDLRDCLKELQESVVAKYQNSPTLLSKLFPPRAVEKITNQQYILYTNGGQNSLIATDGKKHYFYDLLKGVAASFDVKEALGAGLIDVSGKESEANLRNANAIDPRNAFRMVLDKNRDNLGRNIETAISYALRQIEAAQKPKPEQRKTATFGFGSSSTGA